MTEIVTWNIQCGLGVDGRIDLARIADVIRGMGDPDVICLQEISRFMPPFDAGGKPDQVQALSDLFPDHEPFFGAALDRMSPASDKRQSFGNLILSRLPVLSVFRHHLPQPAEAGLRHMPRQAIEITVPTPSSPVRIVTTHLEFHSLAHRQAQVSRLRALHAEVAANVRRPPAPEAGGPYEAAARPEHSVLCGDFNFEPGGPEFDALTATFAESHGTPAFLDAWPRVHGTRPHDPTCGIFDKVQWPGGAHCRDFFFVTHDIADRIVAIEVDTATDASDHQPVLLTLAD